MASPIRAHPQLKRRRTLKDLDDLPRSAALSTLRAAFERTGHDVAAHWPSRVVFSPTAWWQWFREYGKHVLQGRYPLPSYAKSETKCVYPLRALGGDNDPVRVSMTGDWGTGTEEAEDVMEGMKASDPEFTIHLGDVYYIGDEPSIAENCLGIPNPANGFTPVKWDSGNIGSFAMMGNHEMYATGRAYVERFLPTLGMLKEDKTSGGQTTSFFCLQNRDWRIIALDTGYNSRGLPFLNFLPNIPIVGKAFSLLRPSCRLTDDQMKWLEEVIRPSQPDKRGIVLLSHHQYFTVFSDDSNFTQPAEQIQAVINRPALWFWGHEHRMAGYEFGGASLLKVHGRCVGHGGMPVSRRDPPPKNADGRLLFYDNREYKDGFGMNGYVTLEFHSRLLKIIYFDLNRQPLVSEKWSLNSDGGVVRDEVSQLCMDDEFYGPTKWGKRISG